MRLAFTLCAAVLLLIYPFLIYTGLQNVSPAGFGCGLVVLCVTRFFFTRDKWYSGQSVLLLTMIVLSGFAAITNSVLLLRLYPVGMNIGMGLIFFLSLHQKESFIEQMARLSGKDITPRAKKYTRKLTAVWGSVLVLNAAVSLYLALFASLKVWALYCGLIAYMLFGALFVAELAYRQHYIKKHGA